MVFSFKRITSSGNFIPEIDGLRFIAIASVVLYHLNAFLTAKTTDHSFSFLSKILSKGSLGVPLFFAISGFILGMPFAKLHMLNGKPVNLKKYFLRRVTRLEPPYILVMTVLFFATVFVAGKLTINDGLKSYVSSVFYIHNFVYGIGTLPLLNGVAWSLEIEVQFYILAPIMALLFSVRQASVRRIMLGGIACFFVVLNYFIDLPFLSLINYLQYFLVGFLLVDLYISNTTILPKTKADNLISLIFFIALWLFNKKDFTSNSGRCIWELMMLISIFLFYYYVLLHKTFKFLSFYLITNIGGMCYSIYLIHYPIISILGNPIIKHTFSKLPFINLSVYCIVILSVVMAISSAFFLLVERPCMDKDWYKKVFKMRATNVHQI